MALRASSSALGPTRDRVPTPKSLPKSIHSSLIQDSQGARAAPTRSRPHEDAKRSAAPRNRSVPRLPGGACGHATTRGTQMHGSSGGNGLSAQIKHRKPTGQDDHQAWTLTTWQARSLENCHSTRLLDSCSSLQRQFRAGAVVKHPLYLARTLLPTCSSPACCHPCGPPGRDSRFPACGHGGSGGVLNQQDARAPCLSRTQKCKKEVSLPGRIP